eukprot:758153-Hanusia_phi.AAC.6
MDVNLLVACPFLSHLAVEFARMNVECAMDFKSLVTFLAIKLDFSKIFTVAVSNLITINLVHQQLHHHHHYDHHHHDHRHHYISIIS